MTYIYLHGFASGPSSKKATFFKNKLAETGIDLQVPDLAEGDFERLTITRQLAVVKHAAVNTDEITLFGSSMGGYLAALYAARHTEVRRLVLFAPAFGFVRRWEERIGTLAFERWRATGRLPVMHYGFGETRDLNFEWIEDGVHYEDYPSFRQPAIIFHGRHDDVVPYGYSQLFAEQHENVELRLLDSDHELIDVLDPIWEAARRFLENPDRLGGAGPVF